MKDTKQARVMSDKEKRQYFRIDDTVVLQYRQVSEQEVKATNGRIEQQEFNRLTMMAHFDNMTRELQTMLKVIAKTHSTVANCLELVDKKVNMIGEYLVAHMGGVEFWDDYEGYERHSAIYRIANVTTPTQVIHGENDTIIPTAHGRKLHAASPAETKRFVGIPNAGHNDLGWMDIIAPIREFAAQIRSDEKPDS